MELEKIREEFCRLAGITLEECPPYESLVQLGKQEVEQNLMKDVSISGYESALEELAAANAYCWYLMFYDNGADKVSVMDVSIEAGRQRKITQAKQMRQELIRMCQGLWKDTDFVFLAT
ncbi:MAG: hypothetical protein ACOX60_04780 [Massiliimalia sp.]